MRSAFGLEAVLDPSRSRTRRLVAELGLAVSASLLLAASSQIAIPSWPVPFTLQTLAVTVIGALLGSRRGAAAVLLYLAEGALGLPVFAEWGGGLAHFFGPTGGYLIGFVPAAYVVGLAFERGLASRAPGALLTYTVGTAIIFCCGVPWLAYLSDTQTALRVGFVLFVPAALAKIFLAAAITPGFRRRRDQRQD